MQKLEKEGKKSSKNLIRQFSPWFNVMYISQQQYFLPLFYLKCSDVHYCFSGSFWFNNEREKEFLLFISSPDQQGSGKATAGVFTYFFWVLLQPFRGNPEYRDVADLPYNSTCLENIKDQTTDMKSLSKYIMMYFCFIIIIMIYFTLKIGIN